MHLQYALVANKSLELLNNNSKEYFAISLKFVMETIREYLNKNIKPTYISADIFLILNQLFLFIFDLMIT